MLDPSDRQLLLDSLRPPDGYSLDFAIGTTYSLDLLALLTVPLAFTYFDCDGDDGQPTSDPVALLEALRRHARRIAIFCQAGEIKVPPPSQRLVAYLERSIVEVRAPEADGIFHPKVWCLRFVADGLPVLYRMLCLSRNLTFDRCWDSILVLDGELQERKNAIAMNHPLGDFISDLPGMAVRAVDPRIAEKVAEMAEEVRRVRFELPPDVSEIVFRPLGIRRYRSYLDEIGTPSLVVSPFLSERTIEPLARKGTTLISRADQLAALPPVLLTRFGRVFVLDSAAEDGLDENEGAEPGLVGLHAKLMIVDGREARVFTGSANATHNAFTRNIEFVTELVGARSKYGSASFLGDPDAKDGGFQRLLTEWRPGPEQSAADAVRQRLEFRLSKFRRTIAAASLSLSCDPSDDGNSVVVTLNRGKDGAGVEVETAIRARCWPASLRDDVAQPIPPADDRVQFGPMDKSAISAFVAVEASLSEESTSVSTRFLINLPLTDAPADRIEALLAQQLGDPERLMRLLWLLLEENLSARAIVDAVGAGPEHAEGRRSTTSVPAIFELLVKCLGSAPQRIADVGRLIEDLSRTPEGRALLSPELLSFWQELNQALEVSNEPARTA